jgi:hypothetical protein
MEIHMIKFPISQYIVEELIEIHQIEFWITQFGVPTRKLRLSEDRNTGQARNGH